MLCLFFHSKYTKQRESCTLTQTLPCKTGVTCLQQTLGEGTSVHHEGGVLTGWGDEEGQYQRRRKKGKKSWPRACVVSTIFT